MLLCGAVNFPCEVIEIRNVSFSSLFSLIKRWRKCESMSCFSSEGEEEYCGGPAEAAPVRDGANCQDVWRPRDHSADAVHKVKSAC